MKTILELNSKIWYRFLKVLYLLVFVAVFLGYNTFIIGDRVGKIDAQKTIINCNPNGDNKKISLQETGLYSEDFRDFNYEDYLKNNIQGTATILSTCRKGDTFTYNNKTIRSSGVVSADDVYRFQAMADEKLLNGKNLLDELAGKSWPPTWFNFSESDWSPYLTYKTHLFEITLKYSYKDFILSLFVGNFIIISVFFLLRSAFYYVFLGRIRPLKS